MTGGRIHPVLSAALAATRAPPDAARFHLGGPAPVVPLGAQSDLVRWCSEIVTPHVPDARLRARFATLVADAHDIGAAGTTEARQNLRRALEAIALEDPGGPLGIAEALGAVVARLERAPRNAGRTARFAVARTARVLDASGGGAASFLDALDARLLRAEVLAFARRRVKDVEARLDRIVYRGGDERSDPVVWVVRLETGWGALVRRRGFHWSEGGIGDALGIVPDEHLERATDAAFGQEVSAAGTSGPYRNGR